MFFENLKNNKGHPYLKLGAACEKKSESPEDRKRPEDRGPKAKWLLDKSAF